MARFAGNPTNRGRYNFSPSIQYVRMPGTSAASQNAGSVVPTLYNQLSKTGWQPDDTLATSIALRAREKSAAIQADARERVAEITKDAYITAAKKTASGYGDMVSDQKRSATVGSALGAAANIALSFVPGGSLLGGLFG
tara:strand:+ start:183 stop:599 length:417 start_codon:yes stop_codon:yes gene_type:complete